VRATTAAPFALSRPGTTRGPGLTPSFKWKVSFSDYGIPPGRQKSRDRTRDRQIVVPEGEWARLRMYMSLGTQPSNLDLFVTF